jgi:uncharacterized RDD family membrane protein YckC
MSRRRSRQATLFELEEEESVPTTEAPPDEALELALDLDLDLDLDLAAPRAAAGVATERRAASAPAATAAAAPLRASLLAALGDLAFHLLIAGTAALGAALLGVTPRSEQLPGLALLLLVVSYFYTVVPLAFWGRTPGMAAAGLACRGEDGQPLSFAEAVRRWVGSVLTVILLGLPALLLLGGARRSLADRLSGRPVARD